MTEKVDLVKAQAALEQAITQMRKGEFDLGFVGCVLQSLTIGFNSNIPTAGIRYNPIAKAFQMAINPTMFLNWNLHERTGVLTHEVYHVFHKHVFIPAEGKDKLKLNVAMDLVINQLIAHLPEGAMLIKNFKDKSGKPFPANKTFEEYYDLLDGATIEGGKDGEGKERGPRTLEQAFGGEQNPFDDHDFDPNGVGAKEKMEAAMDLFKRSESLADKGCTTKPDWANDFMQALKAEIKKLDAKAILLSTLKRSAPAHVRMKTWKRPSRRWGELAQGNKMGQLPKFYVLVDTSGSISEQEINQFFQVTSDFLNVGVDKTMVGFFHTELYKEQRVKRKFSLSEVTKGLQSGGTDLTDAFRKLKGRGYDLLIVLTDGYFGLPNVDTKGLPETVFVISKDGTIDHPLKKFGKTVKNA